MGVTGCAHPGQGQTEVQRGWVEGWTRELSHLWREDVGEQVCLRHKLSGVSLHKTPRFSFLLFPLASHSPAWECCLSTSALGRLPCSHGQSQHRMFKSEAYGVPDSAKLKISPGKVFRRILVLPRQKPRWEGTDDQRTRTWREVTVSTLGTQGLLTGLCAMISCHFYTSLKSLPKLHIHASRPADREEFSNAEN